MKILKAVQGRENIKSIIFHPPGLIRQTHRKIRAASADGAYDTRLCHDELRRKKISALIPPRKGAGYWPGEYDMGLSGSEWTNDWYAEDYYSHSPVKNPQGPEQGTKKVLRGNVGGDRQYAIWCWSAVCISLCR